MTGEGGTEAGGAAASDADKAFLYALGAACALLFVWASVATVGVLCMLMRRRRPNGRHDNEYAVRRSHADSRITSTTHSKQSGDKATRILNR